MKLKKLIALEIASAGIFLFIALNVIQFNPFLASSSQNLGIGLLKEIEFPAQNVTLWRDGMFNIQFNYSSYEPAILILDIAYQRWENPGYITVVLNGRIVGNILASPETKRTSLSIISCSGIDWVRPRETNFVMFISDYYSGYEGTFTCSIKLRGSR